MQLAEYIVKALIISQQVSGQFLSPYNKPITNYNYVGIKISKGSPHPGDRTQRIPFFKQVVLYAGADHHIAHPYKQDAKEYF